MNQLLDKGAVICAVFAGTDEEGYRYVIGSRSEDVRSISKTLNSTLEGRTWKAGDGPGFCERNRRRRERNNCTVSVAG